MTKLSVVLACAAFTLLGAQAAPALALSESASAPPAVVGGRAEITVTGSGSVSAAPDAMRLYVGVEVHKGRAAEAFAAVKSARARLARALASVGIAAADMQTSGLGFGADYQQDGVKVVGYQASQNVQVLLRDLSKADAVVDAVAAVGEDVRINGIAFEVAKVEALVAKARAAAYRDALARAQEYASLSGRRLGRVVKLEEQSDTPTSRFAMAADQSFISPGQGAVTVTVRAVYELV
ncbi:SIMPL domain-containing protein [Nonomuraea indica]|uniref:SIMPL domain-containing protein n=1 Tax=Nonomuraea indica TaxID=1581193 RepID=A0ABW8A978_9ACTN|nr:SIMPL domain-containing protein [Nonomuraea indica]